MNAVTTVIMIRGTPGLTNLENEYFCEERHKRDTANEEYPVRHVEPEQLSVLSCVHHTVPHSVHSGT